MTTRTCHRCGTPFEPTRSPHGLCPKCLIGVGMRDADEVEPATERVAPTVAAVAPLFPELDLVELVGQGGMGFVFRARHRELERDVALKLLAREHALEPSFAERFRREARTLARLSHPGIVAIFDSGERGGWFYLVMEFVDGANLRHLMKSTRIEPKQALSIVSQVCAALQYSHDQGVVHRDVKPENVLIDVEGRVKIADFGLARLVDRDLGAFALTGSHQVIGTPHYMAPEQWEKPQSVDHRADIYALGVVFYELLTGEMPLGRFDAPSKRVHIDVRLDEVVLKALEKQPERRYQRASEVQTDLDSIARDETSRAHPVPTPEAATLAWAGVFGLGIVMLALAFALFLIARTHFAERLETRNAWWGAAFGLAAASLLPLISAHGRLARRPDFVAANRSCGFTWIDGGLGLLAAVGGVGLVAALSSRADHPATETLWITSIVIVMCTVLVWLTRQFTSRYHARPSADDAREPSDAKLFAVGLLLFVGLHCLCSAASSTAASAIVSARGEDRGDTWPLAWWRVSVVLGLPCVIIGWHWLKASSRGSAVWTRAGFSGFDFAVLLFVAWASYCAVAATLAPRDGFVFWIYALHAATELPVAAYFAWRRWSSRSRVERVALEPGLVHVVLASLSILACVGGAIAVGVGLIRPTVIAADGSTWLGGGVLALLGGALALDLLRRHLRTEGERPLLAVRERTWLDRAMITAAVLGGALWVGGWAVENTESVSVRFARGVGGCTVAVNAIYNGMRSQRRRKADESERLEDSRTEAG
ncbi:MAG: serine/threonine protein kinase [Planctomycetes bacterium]|nr:serine/threonine protein kinase [Planctomycetota bacterium]